MKRESRWGWLPVLSPLLLCLPCLLLPLGITGAGAVLAAVGAVLIGALWLLAVGVGLALVFAAVLLVRRRPQTAACCSPPAPAAEPTPVEPLEVQG